MAKRSPASQKYAAVKLQKTVKKVLKAPAETSRLNDLIACLFTTASNASSSPCRPAQNGIPLETFQITPDGCPRHKMTQLPPRHKTLPKRDNSYALILKGVPYHVVSHFSQHASNTTVHVATLSVLPRACETDHKKSDHSGDNKSFFEAIRYKSNRGAPNGSEET